MREAAPVTLPAEPGTYTFPAPHILYDYRNMTFGLDQEAGGHAIAAQIALHPGDGATSARRSRSTSTARRSGAPSRTGGIAPRSSAAAS